MKTRRKIQIRALAVSALICAYPLFVLSYTWWHVFSSDLPGGRGGPLDAYRHTLASAVVAYTLDDAVVEVITSLTERGGRDSNAMDRHNNRIGATIGSQAGSFAEIEPTVYAQVSDGEVNTQSDSRTTWLPEDRWGHASVW